MWLFTRMDEVVLLEVGELGETLFTQVALEWPLATVHTEMYLYIQKSKKKIISISVKSNSKVARIIFRKRAGLELLP